MLEFAGTCQSYIQRINQFQTNIWSDGHNISRIVLKHPAFKGVMDRGKLYHKLFIKIIL